jgi:ABC-type nitrate/sulfonate/bicarbonate transport system permease component
MRAAANALPSAARRLRGLAVSAAVPVVIVVVWWLASAGSTSPFYPPLSTILENFRETWLFAHVRSDVLPSLRRAAAGYLLAVVAGIVFGVLLGRVRALDRALQPAVQFLRAIPATGLVPVAITLLGIADAPKIWLIGFVCAFPILLNTIDGVRSSEPVLLDVSRSFGLTRRQRIILIELPTAAPRIVAGMRISLAIAFIMMVVSEMVGATNGIGYVTLNAQQSFQVPLMWSGMLLLGILGAALNTLFVIIERRLLRWHYRQ